MSTRPDYDGAAKAIWRVLGEVPSRALAEGSIYEVAAHAAVDAALGDDLSAFAVAALVAEGGEIVTSVDAIRSFLDHPPGRYLIFPIPAESPEVPT